MLKRLKLSFGIRGLVLKWFASYLHDRHQSVLVNGVLSASSHLEYGVPQGSVLGPVLFTLYSQPLSDVISAHGCNYHKYADDTELSSSASPDLFYSAQAKVQSCIDDVLSWMDSNKLMLNTSKTEVMPVGSTRRLRLVDSDSSCIGGHEISHKPSVKYLGVKIDQSLTMRDQVSSICRACFLELRRLASIRPYLTESTCAKLVSCLVLSRLDYCNSVLAGLQEEQLCRLQRVQNNAARLVLGCKKRHRATPLLQKLHWLPVKHRCKYKLAVLAYRHFDGSLPPYLSSALSAYQPPRTLRSSSEKLLKIPKKNLKLVGERSFSFLAPTTWNSLPCKLRNSPTLPTFKKHLKTFFFRQAFPQSKN